MAEFLFRHLAAQNNRAAEFEVASAAVSTEETGNDLYPPAQRKLREKGVPFGHHTARQVTRADYKYYNHLICMDSSNLRYLRYLIGDDEQEKVSLMMNWANEQRDVEDPWYTGNFEATYNDLLTACTAMLHVL